MSRKGGRGRFDEMLGGPNEILGNVFERETKDACKRVNGNV